MKALKLLTQVNIYLPSIYRALTKYACKLYRKCTGRVLKDNRSLYSDFFLTNFAPSSRSLRAGYEWASSPLRRTCRESRSRLEAASSGGRTRLEERANKVRSNVVNRQMDVSEQFLAATRSISAFNQIRTLFYRKPSIHRFCTAYFPSLTREMDGAGTLQLRCRDRKVQNKVRTRLKQSTNQIQISFLSFLLILMQKVVFKMAKSVPLVYGLFTGSVPILYQECTEKLLKRYQRPTKASSLTEDLQVERSQGRDHGCSCISQACVMHMLSNGQAWIVRKTLPVDTLLTHYQHSIYASSILDRCLKNASSQIRAFKRFNLLSQAYGRFYINNVPDLFKSRLNRLLTSSSDVIVQHTHSKIMNIGRAFSLMVLMFFSLLDCVLTELKSIRTYSLLVLMFSMFSLSAQTPRKDSGADGLSHLISLNPGDKIPDAVWNQTLELNYFDGKKKTIKFSDLKGKLIILDFWATWCGACIEGIPKMELIQDRFKGKVEILMVNSKRNKDTRERIKSRFKKYKDDFNYTPSLATLLDDTLFTKLFEHNTLPSISIINRSGEFIATVNSKVLTDENIKSIYDGKPFTISNIGAYVNAGNRGAEKPLFDTSGVHYLSSFSGFRDHFLPVYPNLIYRDGTTYLKMGNQNLGFLLKQAFKSEMDGFSWNQFVFDDRLGKQFKINLRNATLTANQYWYEFYSRDSVTQNEFSEVFKKDFQQNFQVAVAVRQDSINVYRVTFTDAVQKIASREKMRIMRGSDVEREIFYQRVPIENIINGLYYAFEFPIEIDGRSQLLVDLTIPEGFSSWETDRKLNFFKERGIVFSLTKEKRSYPYVYSLKQSN